MKKYTLLLALGLTAALAISPTAARAGDSGTDVFADEGDADFNSIPTDVSKVPPAPALAVPAAAQEMEDAPTPAVMPAPQPPPTHVELHRKNATHEAAKKSDDTFVADESSPAAPHPKYFGFRITGKDCPMYRGPASEGEPVLTVKSEKRIWIQNKGEWMKVFSHSGPGYLAADCFK